MSEIKWSDPTYFTDKHALSMTLRDYFAAKAMQASMASPELMKVVTSNQVIGGDAAEKLAAISYKYADTMLKAREG